MGASIDPIIVEWPLFTENHTPIKEMVELILELVRKQYGKDLNIHMILVGNKSIKGIQIKIENRTHEFFHYENALVDSNRMRLLFISDSAHL